MHLKKSTLATVLIMTGLGLPAGPLWASDTAATTATPEKGAPAVPQAQAKRLEDVAISLEELKNKEVHDSVAAQTAQAKEKTKASAVNTAADLGTLKPLQSVHVLPPPAQAVAKPAGQGSTPSQAPPAANAQLTAAPSSLATSAPSPLSAASAAAPAAEPPPPKVERERIFNDCSPIRPRKHPDAPHVQQARGADAPPEPAPAQTQAAPAQPPTPVSPPPQQSAPAAQPQVQQGGAPHQPGAPVAMRVTLDSSYVAPVVAGGSPPPVAAPVSSSASPKPTMPKVNSKTKGKKADVVAVDKSPKPEKAQKAPSYEKTHPEDPLQVPYSPGQGAILSMEATDTWVEVYSVPSRTGKKALNTLKSKETPPALGVIADDTFYGKMANAEMEAGLTAYTMTRKGTPIEYDIDCKQVPKKGDVLEATFKDAAYEVKLKGTIVEHFVFGLKDASSTEATRLAGLTPKNCHLLDEQRIIYQGTVTISKDGKVVGEREVMLQSIAPN